MANTAKRAGDQLTPSERKKLLSNFKGYDISPDMVRLSLVNLYLHNFVQPQIYEYDTLTSEDRWNEYADVILANPPFMSPKGGIIPHKHFSVQSKRSEVLFVDYIAEHLSPSGRAAVIVPEGIIFQGAGAYKQLRKMLVEKYLYAVVSLPAGVFNPYSGVKTSILFMDRRLAAKTDAVLFVKVENDGFDLGAQRRAIEKNDLPGAAEALREFRKQLEKGITVAQTAKRIRNKTTESTENTEKKKNKHSVNSASSVVESSISLLVPKAKIAENDEYNLTGERYRVVERRGKQKWPMVKLGEVCETSSGGTPLKNKPEYWEHGSIPWLKSGEVSQGEIYNTEEKITKIALKESSAKIFPIDTVLVAMYGATAGQVGLLKIEATTNQAICGICPTSNYIPKFLYFVLLSQKDLLVSMSTGGAQPNISQSIIRNLEIPLPPVEVQRKIVAEIEEYQMIIDGARQVVDNWKPQIEVEPDWPMVKLGEAPIEIIDGDRGESYPKKEDFSTQGYCLFLNTSNVRKGHFNFDDTEFITKEKDNSLRKGKLIRNDIVLTTRGTVGNIAFYSDDIPYKNIRINSGMLLLRVDTKKFNPLFIVQYFLSDLAIAQIRKILSGSAQPQLPIRSLVEFEIPFPPREIQEEIVGKIEVERKLVDGCRDLMVRYEERIKKAVDGVWK
jgi:type I restriction enzyme M protein